VNASEADALWDRISAGANSVSSPRESGVAAMRSYLALKRLACDLNLSGISLGGYPKCQGTACLPISLLNDDGLVAGCEGDTNSTRAMFLLRRLTGLPVHFGEMLELDESENTIVSSHCGSAPLSLADQGGFLLCAVRLANSGVCVRFTSKPGPVTFVNLVGRKSNYRLCALEGEAVPSGMVFEGNPLRIRPNTPLRRIWDAVATHGFGHHWMSGYAHVVPELVEFCRLAGIRGVFPALDAPPRSVSP
jgi:L-fucose isomerase-like protein